MARTAISTGPTWEMELERCIGVFQVHCRGVGTDWSPPQLRHIAEELIGTVHMIADPDGLELGFHNTLTTALSHSVADLRLRLWLPCDTKLRCRAMPAGC